MPKKRSCSVKIATLHSVLQDCYQLKLEELKYLKDAIDVLIDAEEKRLSELEADSDWEEKREEKMAATGARGSTGYIESKTIKGCGPYAYLRFLDILPPLIRSTEYSGGFPRILGSQFIEPT
jgi:hypothetical protein